MEEVLDHAPEGLPLAERMTAVVVAQWANDETRAGWPGMDRLKKRTGLKDRAIQEAIAGLVDAGIVERLVVSIDRNGRPVYAHRGHRAQFRLAPLPWTPLQPDVVPPAPEQQHEDEQPGLFDADLPGVVPPAPGGPELSTAPAESPHQDAPFPLEKGRTDREKGRTDPGKGRAVARPFSSSLQESLQIDARALAILCTTAIEALAERTGTRVDDDHALLVVRQLLVGRPDIRSPARYVRGAIARDKDPQRFLPTPTPPPLRDDPGRP